MLCWMRSWIVTVDFRPGISSLCGSLFSGFPASSFSSDSSSSSFSKSASFSFCALMKASLKALASKKAS